MNQTRWESLEETIVNTCTGFCLSMVIQLIFFPLFGIRISFSSNLLLTGIFTIASVARGYLLRRYYNKRKRTITSLIIELWRKFT